MPLPDADRELIRLWSLAWRHPGIRDQKVFEATGQLPDPEWPDLPFKELLRIAFKDRFISDLNHPVLHRLRGEV